MSMASVTDFTDGELVDELQDRGFTVTWGRGVEIAELRQQLAAKDDEIRELVTSDNKVIVDLSRYVETLEQQIDNAQKEYGRACHLVAQMHAAAVGEVTGPKLGVVEDVAELRRQLADRDEQISDLTISSDTYFAERNSARDVWRRASKDRDELRQQLAAALACNILLKDALFDTLIQEMSRESAIARIEAIALQPDNSALRAWLGEPVAMTASGFRLEWCGPNWGIPYPEGTPLYAPKGMA